MEKPKIDYKKLEKEFYFPKKVELIDVPKMKYIVVDGEGAPSGEQFQHAMGILYPIAFTISMSYKGADFVIEDFERFVVPPLEGLWTTNTQPDGEFLDKDDFVWRVMIRMPEFVTEEVVKEAKEIVKKKKGIDTSLLKYMEIEDGLCVQAMHIGPFDNEPETFKKMFEFARENSLNPVHKEFHHREIYMSDFRKTKPENLKTVLRIFVEKEEK